MERTLLLESFALRCRDKPTDPLGWRIWKGYLRDRIRWHRRHPTTDVTKDIEFDVLKLFP